jgi:lytic murein transglycosylase
MTSRVSLTILALAAALILPRTTALAATCGTGNFDAWLADFKTEAASKGISQAAITAGLNGVTLDQSVLSRDHSQKVFSQTFEEFSGRMVPPRMTRGSNMMKQYGSVLSRIEQTYGVPGEVLVAIWGLETDFGVNTGKFPTIRSLATLAYDCRRADQFRAELMDALRIVERGDLAPGEMRGAWAGEIGQTQFMPSSWMKFAVDFDGNGKRDLIGNVPDVLASTGNYLKGLGWRRGEPWLKEVRLPATMDWSQADLSIEHSVGEWASMGVTPVDGGVSPGLQASLLLPMGRFGPAFFAFHNFKVYLEWNQSLVYSMTAAYLATRIAGAPAVARGHAVPFGYEQTKELQSLLKARGYDVGDVDGKLGLATRASVRKVQLKLGLPADSYPTAELLARLQSH